MSIVLVGNNEPSKIKLINSESILFLFIFIYSNRLLLYILSLYVIFNIL